MLFNSLEYLSWRTARKLVVLVIGTTVLLLGAAAAVLPVLPAVVIIPAGLAILATEFLWARRLLRKVRDGARNHLRTRRSTSSKSDRP